MDNTLLVTKTYRPRPRARAVTRKNLFARLAAGLERKITLVAAPAGFGKTTLLSAWVQQMEGRDWQVAWLSLDQNDNDPYRFWSYVIAAFQTVETGFGEALQAALLTASPSAPPLTLQPVIAFLVNALSALQSRVILVLDDYHAIRSPLIHDSLNDLIDHLPANMHLVIATREDPPLALARRRARAELLELRAVDLRFSPTETADLFNSCLGLELLPNDVEMLYQRTDGWVAGLHLAGLSLQDRAPDDCQKFIRAFTGDDRFIFDYLMAEVFFRLDTRQLDFLLRTSILDRLCGPLCQELTGFDDSAELLSQLERANLFVQSLDNRRQWFRYHPLLADLLRQRLQKTVHSTEIQRLYHQASRWYERQGLLLEAVAYAASDPEFAAVLIERHVLDVFYHSDIYMVHQWLKALPEAVLYRHPLLCAVYADTISVIQVTPQACDEAERLLKIAESQGPLEAETVAIIAKFRAYLARFYRNPPEEVIRLVMTALDLIPEGSIRFRSALAFLEGACLEDIGDEAGAERAYCDAQEFGLKSEDWFNALTAVERRTSILIRHGNLRKAASLCHTVLEALHQAQHDAVNLPPIAGALYCVIGSLLVEWNDLDEADKHLFRAQKMLELTALPNAQTSAFLTLARLKAGRRDAQGALAAIQKAEALPFMSELILPFKMYNLLLLAENDSTTRAELERWAMDRRLDLEHAGRENLEQFTLARWLVLHKARNLKPDHPSLPGLSAFLKAQFDTAKSTRRTKWLIEILILQALICQEQGEGLRALELLDQALALGEPEGYIRLFVEYGSSMRQLLVQRVKRQQPSGYAERLLEIIERETGPRFAPALPLDPQQRTGGAQTESDRVERLSDRETEVLCLLAEGLSNQQIAARLHLSPNTVRIHASAIYGKLGVGSRTQAAAKARALGLLG